jgi:hypothetical protein
VDLALPYFLAFQQLKMATELELAAAVAAALMQRLNWDQQAAATTLTSRLTTTSFRLQQLQASKCCIWSEVLTQPQPQQK